MTEAEYTPGSWSFDNGDAVDAIEATSVQLIHCDIIINQTGQPPILLATVYSDDVDDLSDKTGKVTAPNLRQAEANARLITAAPDLLRELYEFHEDMIDNNEHVCDPDGCSIQAAINKAIGT